MTTDSATLRQLKQSASLVETGAYSQDERRMSRAVRLPTQVRRKLNASVLSSLLNFALVPGSEVHSRLMSFLPEEDKHDIEVDAATLSPAILLMQHLPELEIYCYLVVLIFLIDQRRYIEAKSCASASISRLKNLKWRTIDVLASRLYFYYSFTYELAGDLAEIRRNLFSLHIISTLSHDKLSQGTLLSLLVRNYLHYNLYDQAEKLMKVAPTTPSNPQLCRLRFYWGKTCAIQLKYTDAKYYLVRAAYGAPVSALGFRVQCNKWAIIVHLLLGEIPNRTVFTQKGLGKALRPYFELANAVRMGDLELFRTVSDKFARVFETDKTHNLIIRLRHNVIRAGLRNISRSYSRISFSDIAKKLRLDFANAVADIESIIAKAIRDGVINATLDHANRYMVLKESGDVYSTNVPKDEFSKRIVFLFDIHNKAVRALRFPPNPRRQKDSDEKRRESQQQRDQELAMKIAEEDDHYL